MAHSLSAKKVVSAVVFMNEDASNNIEQRGAVVFGEIDITSYTASGEIVNAALLGLNEVYNCQMQVEETRTNVVRAVTVASDRKSVTVRIDSTGGSTEISASTDAGRISFIAWGEALGSGTN